MNEATARIRINRQLEAAGWRFFADGGKPANICLEHGTAIRPADLEALGGDFEHAAQGKIDFLLLNSRGFPFVVLEAKAESRDPLEGKEQARRYARAQNCRFVILSNGNLHYFWDLDGGNPSIITRLPAPESIEGFAARIAPDRRRLSGEDVREDYIALTQLPTYATSAGWQNESERPEFVKLNKLRFLRPYQLQAVHAVQRAVKDERDRFLFEMATGTGKTLLSAAIIKLFLRTGNANRVLFLVDRLELETQAWKAFRALLSNDFKTVIYKESRNDWRHAEIVVSTVQSLLFGNKYQQAFSPTDFDLVISDEAHRSIGGNARSVFDYFIGYKLGLTATPRDYLKKFDASGTNDPREHERRLLLDTYRTFGCEDSQPTFRYSLIDGVRDGFLVSPTVIDARSSVTTKLLSDEGFVVNVADENGNDTEQTFKQRQFERRFFSAATNQLLCKTFLDNGLRDPISGEFGKSIVFAVSQRHAAKLVQVFNAMADRLYPGKYQSDFAVQVTSNVQDAQGMTIAFANNNLLGSANFLETYKTSKARVCVTVGMMTTGYDCPDVLNIGLFRPIFSPTDFIQIKGRGTRLHDFREELSDENIVVPATVARKSTFKLFDFFANCEYFEEGYDYDQVIALPIGGSGSDPDDGLADWERETDDNGNPGPVPPGGTPGTYQHMGDDLISSMREEVVGAQGMRIDREFYQRFEDAIRENQVVASAVEAGEWDRVIDYVNKEVFDKPDEYYSLDKLRRAAAVDRRLTLREILQKIFGLIPRYKSKDELLEEEFAKFVADAKPSGDEIEALPVIRTYFKAYVVSGAFREIIDQRRFTELATNPLFSMKDYKAVPEKYRVRVPEYVKDYVPLNQFVA